MSVPGFFPFSDLPPEIQQQIDRQQMQVEEFRLGIARLFDDLEEDKLRTFVQLMGHFSSMRGRQVNVMASYYQGIGTAKLQERFGACASCGGNHDLTPEQFHAEDETQDKQTAVPPVDVREDEEFITVHPVPDELNPEDLQDMIQYRLDDVRDQDTLKLIQFKCLGCGMVYGSIADRMKEPPGVEGCSGCRQKTKWG